jgi:hypothetical protein
MLRSPSSDSAQSLPRSGLRPPLTSAHANSSPSPPVAERTAYSGPGLALRPPRRLRADPIPSLRWFPPGIHTTSPPVFDLSAAPLVPSIGQVQRPLPPPVGQSASVCRSHHPTARDSLSGCQNPPPETEGWFCSGALPLPPSRGLPKLPRAACAAWVIPLLLTASPRVGMGR